MVSKRLARLAKILSGATPSAEDEIFILEDRRERFVHFWVLVVRQFIRHRCLARASALSYSTLIALIPLLALALSLTNSFLKTQGQQQFQSMVEKSVAMITPPATISLTNTVANTNLILINTTNVVSMTTASGLVEWKTNVVITAANTNLVLITTTNIVSATNSSGLVEWETNVVITAATPPVVAVNAQKEIANYIWSFVQNTQSGAVGATGVVLLIFISISLLGRIEETFNDIWGVQRGRNLLTQIQLYSTTIMLGPLLLIAALSLAGSSNFQSVKEFIGYMPVIGKLIFQLLPLMVIWLAFTLIYQLLPNTKVNFSAALIGGAVAGTLWHLNNVLGFLYLSRVVTNSKIYGSIGLIPVLMIGLYFSWVFLLLGCQIAYAFQNRAAYLQDRLADNVNQRGREFVALRLMTRLGQRFYGGVQPATINQLSKELGIPTRLTHSILRVLACNGLVRELAGSEAAFVPARPLDTISAYDILYAMRTGTSIGQGLPADGAPELAEIYGEFAAIEQAERQAANSISLLALSVRMHDTLALNTTTAIAPEKQIAPAKTISTSEAESEKKFTPVIESEPEPGPVEPEPAVAQEKSASPTINASSATGEKRRDVVRPPEESEFPL